MEPYIHSDTNLGVKINVDIQIYKSDIFLNYYMQKLQQIMTNTNTKL